MSTLYITQQGAVLSKTGEHLKITLDKELVSEVPLVKVSQVVVCGNILVTPPTINLLMRRGIEICYLTQYGDYVGRTHPELSKNGELRLEQYKTAVDPKRRLNLARRFVLGKFTNFRTMLVEKARKEVKSDVKKVLKQIKAAERGVQKSKNLDTLRAREGEGSAAYFSVFESMLKIPEFKFTARTRRPPADPVNALLSFGYTLLTSNMCAAVNVVGFDPYIGFLHAEEYGRPSLPLDLIEEFRPIIVDTMVLACLNQRLLTRADFQETEGNGIRLTDEARHTFLKQYRQRIGTAFMHPVLKRKMTYQHSFEQQARLLAKTLQGEADAYIPLEI